MLWGRVERTGVMLSREEKNGVEGGKFDNFFILENIFSLKRGWRPIILCLQGTGQVVASLIFNKRVSR